MCFRIKADFKFFAPGPSCFDGRLRAQEERIESRRRVRRQRRSSRRMSAIHEKSHRTYGAPRIHAELEAEGIQVGASEWRG
jgi:hypothetical protein